MSKRFLALGMALTLMVPSTSAFAAVDQGSVYNLDGTLFASGPEVQVTPLKKNQINTNQANFLYGYANKLYKMTDASDAYVAAGGDMTAFGAQIATKTEQNPAGAVLAVDSISAINTTTIKVTFNNAVTDAAALKANFTLTNGTIETATKTGEKEVTLSVAGLTYQQSTTVTVLNPSYTKAVTVPAINELYTLTITTDATGDAIKSDGASATMLTASIIEKATNVAVVKDAQIQFTTTLGSLSQPQVALQNGLATTQLNSIASATSVTAVVNATVASCPTATEYVGLTGTKIVNFTPDGTSGGTTTMVSAVSAGSDQGDRFYVKFSGDITAAAYKSAIGAANIALADFGIQYKGVGGAFVTPNIIDVYNLTSNTLMFVLDTDDTGSVAPALGDVAATDLEMMDANFAHTTADNNFLRDNVNHTVKFPANIPGLVVNSSNITFMMSDVTKPFIYGVTATDNMNLTVRASEALSQNLVETTADALGGARAANQINSNFTIDGKVVRLDSTPTLANIAAAKLANEIIVTELSVGKYAAGADARNIITFKIHKDFKLAAGLHGIQISKIGDLAGHTDPINNTVTTQTFSFNVAADVAAPTATVVQQSPEQFLITFNKPVDSVTGKDIEDVLKIYTKTGYEAAVKVPLVMNNNSGANDYVVSSVDADGVGTNLATNATLTGVTRLLVEFNRDWSVKLSGGTATNDNYWKSAITPLTFTLGDVESSTGVAMTATTQNVALSYDGVSPTIAEATDLYAKSPDVAFRGTTATSSGQAVYVKMSEPVQLVTAAGVQITNPVTPNLQQDTTPAAFNATTGLPRSTYRFINNANPDTVVLGTVGAAGLAQDDMSFLVTPASALTAGEWTLYIEQISDDHGNTSATISKVVTVPEPVVNPVVTATKVAWAAFDNNAAGDYDYLYVKFTKEMKAYTANGVDATTNYKFRGYDLPQGSDITVGIEGITNAWDGVTIRMPKGAWDGLTATDFTTNMSVASNFQSASGEALSGAKQFELTDSNGTSAADKDGLAATGQIEAAYYQVGTVGGKTAVKATASDSDFDGDIDTITFITDVASTTTAADFIYVNGKKFFNTTVGSATTQVYEAADNTGLAAGAVAGSVGTYEIAGTLTTGLVITDSSNAILMNTSKTVDAAKPALIRAVISTPGATAGFGNNVGDVITLTFSEPINTNFAVANAPTAAELEAIFTASGGALAAGTVTATDLSVNASNVLVLTTTGAFTNPILAANTISTKAVPTANDIESVDNVTIVGNQNPVTVE